MALDDALFAAYDFLFADAEELVQKALHNSVFRRRTSLGRYANEWRPRGPDAVPDMPTIPCQGRAICGSWVFTDVICAVSRFQEEDGIGVILNYGGSPADVELGAEV